MNAKDMTDQQLNRALAELMGYTVYHYDKDVLGRCYFELTDPEGYPEIVLGGERKTEPEAWGDAPDYCTDPSASQEIEKVACKKQFYWYIQALSKVVGADGYWDSGALDYEGIKLLLTATPRQMAEAAWMTMRE
ncbi:hypothetical protein F4V43_01695 [Paenibacillus spiritus]|uniref:Phage ABA sandwich domain-containing protein n=1 Tax=Paenibacillus spiritus TaxID=2496557 RepID=A0A5J5GG96_9BACL|nr:hypothetical protein [Paenibacillus spiritus]KAA9007226.1 hypothetical protein F4V43_01695 [Paenibacillus spiritus]